MSPALEGFTLGVVFGVFACLFVEACLLALVDASMGDDE